MEKVLLKTTIALRTLENVIKTNEGYLNDMVDMINNADSPMAKAQAKAQHQKQTMVMQELYAKRNELMREDERCCVACAQARANIYILCDVFDAFAWELRDFISKHAAESKETTALLDRLTRAKNELAQVACDFANECGKAYDSYNVLSDAMVKRISTAIINEYKTYTTR